MAYECTKDVLAQLGFPVADLTFDDPDLACRGLVIDTERGNFLKIDRHGFVRRAMHGSVRLNASEIDVLYGRSQISLRDRRFSFLNTLFSVSEGVLYSQLVSKLDSGALVRDSSPPFDASRVAKYADLHRAVTKALSRAHGGSSTPSRTGQQKGAKFSTFKAPYLRLSFPLSFRAHCLDRGDHRSSRSRRVDAFSDTFDRQKLQLKYN